MANLKRAAALTLSAAMFLQPMTASAATWGNIMSAIRNGQKYTDGKTSAEVNEQGELTVSGGSLDEAKGIITWQITLQPGEQRDLALRYKVKYPKGRNLIIE